MTSKLYTDRTENTKKQLRRKKDFFKKVLVVYRSIKLNINYYFSDDWNKELDEIPGKEEALYRKYGSFCVTPLSDLTGFDPLLRPSKHYSHRIIYKLGVYRRYMKRRNVDYGEMLGEYEESERKGDSIIDIKKE